MVQKRKWCQSIFPEGQGGESNNTSVEKSLSKKLSSNFNIMSTSHRKFKSSSIYDPMMSAMMEPSFSSHTFTLNPSESQPNKRLFSNPENAGLNKTSAIFSYNHPAQEQHSLYSTTSYQNNERFSHTNLPNLGQNQ